MLATAREEKWWRRTRLNMVIIAEKEVADRKATANSELVKAQMATSKAMADLRSAIMQQTRDNGTFRATVMLARDAEERNKQQAGRS